MRISIPLQTLSIIGLGLLCALPAFARMDGGPAGGQDQGATLHLGEVEVHGEQQITRTLQAIKVALTMPYSNDPKLANILVCRLEDSAESHVKKVLICGTNRTLAVQRGIIQSNYTVATAQNTTTSPKGTGCFDSTCYSAAFAQLNETLDSLPGHYLHTTVNGPALRNALQNVPMPAPDASTAVAAPAAATKQ